MAMELDATVTAMAVSEDDPSAPISLTMLFADGKTLTVAITRKQASGLYPGSSVIVSIRKVWGKK